MAECFACKKVLQGSWNMTAVGVYEKTGRYLGINDGYFLYNGSPNWVFCYCYPCWQNAILNLSFVRKPVEQSSIQQQITLFQQQLMTLQQQHATLLQQYTALQQQHTSVQEQLSFARTETVSHRKQLDKMSESYSKSSNNAGIEKLRDLFKQLTPSQIDALHTHTKFRVDTFETIYEEQQLQCFTQFAQSILTQLKSSVDEVIQLQNNALAQRKQAKESVIQTLKTAGVSETTIYASMKPLEAEVEQTEAGIEGWNTFSAVLIDVINQPISTLIKDEELEVEVAYDKELKEGAVYDKELEEAVYDT